MQLNIDLSSSLATLARARSILDHLIHLHGTDAGSSGAAPSPSAALLGVVSAPASDPALLAALKSAATPSASPTSGVESAGGDGVSSNPNTPTQCAPAAVAPPKRTRRTKEQIAADEAKAAAAKAATPPATGSDPFGLGAKFEPVPPPAPIAPAADGSTTFAHVEEAIGKVLAKDFSLALSVLEGFGVKAITQLKPEHYAQLVAKVTEVLK